MNGRLFDDVVREAAIAESAWRPRPLPSLAGIQHVDMDTEGTGLDWWDKARLIGFSVRASNEPWAGEADERCFYAPVRHQGPGNLDEGGARRWCLGELPGKDVYFLNAKYDVQTFRSWGVDLERLGCRVHDVAFRAALLDEERKRYNLRDLAAERLGVSMVDLHAGALSGGKHLMAAKAAAEVGPYAERDCGLLRGLRDSYQPDIDAEGLGRVLAIEERLIWCVCEMERNATPIDQGLLDRWINEATLAYEEDLARLRREAGASINPDAARDMLKMFVLLGVEPVLTPVVDKWGHPRIEDGEVVMSPSFTDDILGRIEAASAGRVRECMRLARAIRHVSSLLSKYLLKYRKAIGSDGKLRYSLNQIGQDDYGTVTGRFSASAPFGGAGYNPQQVFKPSRQARVEAISRWIVRRLFVPTTRARKWLSADAMQIEIRLAAHYAAELGMRRLAELYASDPCADMHEFVQGLVGMNRDDTKNYSFMKLYGGGVNRAMEMTGRDEATCRAQIAQYDAAFPEFRTLMDTVSEWAKKRGYVRTVLGRRRHCAHGQKLHAMLNAVIQGSAGDVMKVKMCEAYDAREELGLTLRLTVHDEMDADCEEDSAPKVQALLNEQSIPFQVPIF